MLFPGQGTLRPGAGHDLYVTYRSVRESVDLAASLSGLPLAAVLERGPAERLAATDVAQVAVVALSLGLLAHLRAEGIRPRVVAGHSVGELSALAAAEVIEPRVALELAIARGQAMDAAAGRRSGGMAAITGLATEDVAALCSESRDHGVVVVAAHNSPVQTVVSGDVAAVDAVADAARRAGALRVDRLAVGGAFHSPLMEPAREAVAVMLRSIALDAPTCVLVSSATGEAVSDLAVYRERLAVQMVTPVRWMQAMAAASRLGGNAFAEMGPGRVLAALARRCDPTLDVVALADVPRCERFLATQRAAQLSGAGSMP